MNHLRIITKYPVFFGYAALEIVSFATVYPLKTLHMYVAYFVAYWAFETFRIFVVLALIRDIYLELFSPYLALRSVGCSLFNWAVALLAVLTTASVLVAPAPNAGLGMQTLLDFDQASTLLQGGLLLVVVMLAQFFRLRWPAFAFGIAQGFAVNFTLSAVALMVRRYYGQEANLVFQVLTLTGFDIAVAMWLHTFFAKQPSTAVSVSFVQADLERWNAELAEIVG